MPINFVAWWTSLRIPCQIFFFFFWITLQTHTHLQLSMIFILVCRIFFGIIFISFCLLKMVGKNAISSKYEIQCQQFEMLEDIVQQQNFRGMVAGLACLPQVNKACKKFKLFFASFHFLFRQFKSFWVSKNLKCKILVKTFVGANSN